MSAGLPFAAEPVSPQLTMSQPNAKVAQGCTSKTADAMHRQSLPGLWAWLAGVAVAGARRQLAHAAACAAAQSYQGRHATRSMAGDKLAHLDKRERGRVGLRRHGGQRRGDGAGGCPFDALPVAEIHKVQVVLWSRLHSRYSGHSALLSDMSGQPVRGCRLKEWYTGRSQMSVVSGFSLQLVSAWASSASGRMQPAAHV